MNALSTLLSHEIAERLGWTLLHSLWQATAIAMLLAVVLKLLARSSAQARYAVVCAGLVAMALLPAATSGLRSSSSDNVPAPTPQRSQSTPVPAPPGGQSYRTTTPATPLHVAVEPRNEQSWRNLATTRLESILPYVVCVWLAGVLLFSLRQLLAWTRLRQLRRKQIRPASGALCDRLSSLARRLGIDRAVKLVESGLVQVPTALGWLRPMILLPACAATGLPADQLEALLLHELAHIRRHDYLVNLVQTIVEILGFYHPAVWWVSRRIRIERENCCDDIAARALGDNLRYVKALASMEDLRVDRAELAMAASGGSLLARIRRLVGQAPSEGNPSTWAPVLIIGLLLLVIAIPAGLAIARQDASSTSDLEQEVLKGFVENRNKFTCGALTWTNDTEDKAGIGGRPIPQGGLRLSGQYQMWWDGDKVATKYAEEGVHSSRETPPAEIQPTWQGSDGTYYWIVRNEGSNVYTAPPRTAEPEWQPLENWLNGVIRWRGRAASDRLIVETRRAKDMAVEWSTVDVDGKKLVRHMVKNVDRAATIYGGYRIEHYDPAKGYGLVREGWYKSDGFRGLNRTVRLEQVIPGAWFPVEVVVERFNSKDGSVISRQQTTLDLAQCRFNDKTALPDGIFEMAPREELDEMRRILAEFYRQRTTAQKTDAEARTQGPRTTAEGFVAAALEGDYIASGKFVDPRQSVDDLKDFSELLTGQNLRLAAVFADAEAALVITSAIRADHGRAGPLTFTLVRSPGSPAGWLIEDIDLETPQEAGSEVERFLQSHPTAAMTLGAT